MLVSLCFISGPSCDAVWLSARVPAGAGTPTALRGGEGQEETGGRQQIHTGQSGRDGQEQDWAGGDHQKVKNMHTYVVRLQHIKQGHDQPAR